MRYPTNNAHTNNQRHDSSPSGDVPNIAPGTYIHPFELIPQVSQPGFDTRFKALLEQRTQRIDALFRLSALTVAEQGPSLATDRWLDIARQNIRDTNDMLGGLDRERACVMGLAATYMASDPTLPHSAEADVYHHRIGEAERLEDISYMSGTPYHDAHLQIRGTMENLAATPGAETVAAHVLELTNVQPDTPAFTQAKAGALFAYAATMPACPEKQWLLTEAMAHADKAFADADGDDHALRGASLHTLARSLHDLSYIPGAFNSTHPNITEQARNFSVALLQRSTQEFQKTNPDDPMAPLVPIDISRPWEAQVNNDTAYNDARYFLSEYGNDVREQGIYIHRTPEIQRVIVRTTAVRFGHQAMAAYGVNESTHSEPTLASVF